MTQKAKTAIVTGASSGIGRETSLLLAAKGYYLALVGRNRHKLDQTAQLAQETSSQQNILIEVIPTDLCDARATRALATTVFKRFGRIDAIANVAGFAPMLSIEKVTDELWQKVIHTNLSSIVNLTAAAWPILIQQKGAVIVNVSSMASIDPFPGLSIYAAAKAAVNMFTRSTAQEGADVAIKAVAIAPGAVETPMLRSLFDESAIPRDQTLDPKTVAKTIVDCIAGNKSFEPGETILMPS